MGWAGVGQGLRSQFHPHVCVAGGWPGMPGLCTVHLSELGAGPSRTTGGTTALTPLSTTVPPVAVPGSSVHSGPQGPEQQ